MPGIIQWMNKNDGFLMVIVTVLYVIATVMICFFNAKSAKASRQQIIEAQKQQQQNMGLQLYGMRKEIITKLSEKKINEIYWDVPLLYDQEIVDDFLGLAFKAGVEEKHIERFESDLVLLFPFTKGISEKRKKYIENNDQKEFEELIMAVRQRCQQKEAIKQIDQYNNMIQTAQDKYKEISTRILNLILKMQKYLKDSISYGFPALRDLRGE